MSDGIPGNKIKTQNTIVQAEHEDSLHAKRVTFIGFDGSPGMGTTPDNPLFVQLSDGSVNIETLNAELEVRLTHLTEGDDPADSVRIGDGVELLAINAQNEALVHDQDTHDRLDSLHAMIQAEFDATQSLLQSEFDETQSLLTSEFNQTQSILQAEFDEFQALVLAESNETQSILQSEFDATQALIQAESDQTQTILQTEFDQTQTELQNINTEINRGQYTMNEAFDKAAAIAGQLDDAATTAATEDNVAPVRITPQRALHTNLRHSGGEQLSSSRGIRVDNSFSNGVNSRPTITSTNSQILAANADRRYALIINSSGQNVYLKLGNVAVVGEGIPLIPGAAFEINSTNLWVGSVNCIKGGGGSVTIDVFEGS